MGLWRVTLCRRWKNFDEYVVAGQILCLKGMFIQVSDLEPHKPFVLDVSLDTAQDYSSIFSNMRHETLAETRFCIHLRLFKHGVALYELYFDKAGNDLKILLIYLSLHQRMCQWT